LKGDIMRYIKIEAYWKNWPQGSYIDKIENISLADLIDGLAPGDDSYRISVVVMSEEAFKALPEFTGF